MKVEPTPEIDPEARAIVDAIRGRLIALVDDPPFRFKNTSRPDAEACLRRMKTFEGCTESEVAHAEKQLGVRFPAVFRAYLLLMGKARGQLLCGSAVARADTFAEFRSEADQLLRESSVNDPLPSNAVVFVVHQGYTFLYFLADPEFDTPIYQYIEGNPEAKQIWPGFANLLDADLNQAERVTRQIREQGGYYLTINGDDVTQTYPALNKGDRPLDQPLFGNT